MKKVILETKYLEGFFDEEAKIFIIKYLPTTAFMTDKEWKEQMLKIGTSIQKHKPVYIIDDNRERMYSYSPDMQAWTLNLFVELWNKIDLKKYAQILPKEIISKLTSEQIEELGLNSFKMEFQYKFVNDEKSAFDWINEAD